MKYFTIAACSLVLLACSEKEAVEVDVIESAPAEVSVETEAPDNQTLLGNVLAAQSDEAKARYEFRHPQETLTFFGVEPGMKVLEVLPGEGWYSKILASYLGSDGALIGADYSLDMWPNFSFVNDEFIEGRKQWPAKWTANVETWGGGAGADAQAHTLADLPTELDGTLDTVLFIRALHNLSRFETEGQYLTQALGRANTLLKEGGFVGVVQHQASEEKDDAWADGSRGYLKKSFVVNAFAAAGFELVDEAEFNQNPKDVPGDDDIVWRLPPTYFTSGDNEEMKQQYAAIGESNRMTLLFRKTN